MENISEIQNLRDIKFSDGRKMYKEKSLDDYLGTHYYNLKLLTLL